MVEKNLLLKLLQMVGKKNYSSSRSYQSCPACRARKRTTLPEDDIKDLVLYRPELLIEKKVDFKCKSERIILQLVKRVSLKAVKAFDELRSRT